MWVQVPVQVTRGFRIPWNVGYVGGCELLDVGTRRQIQVLSESSVRSQLQARFLPPTGFPS